MTCLRRSTEGRALSPRCPVPRSRAPTLETRHTLRRRVHQTTMQIASHATSARALGLGIRQVLRAAVARRLSIPPVGAVEAVARVQSGWAGRSTRLMRGGSWSRREQLLQCCSNGQTVFSSLDRGALPAEAPGQLQPAPNVRQYALFATAAVRTLLRRGRWPEVCRLVGGLSTAPGLTAGRCCVPSILSSLCCLTPRWPRPRT